MQVTNSVVRGQTEIIPEINSRSSAGKAENRLPKRKRRGERERN